MCIDAIGNVGEERNVRELLNAVSGPRMNGQTRLERHLAGYESSSTVMSSELDTTSFCDSEDDDTMSR